MLLHAMLGGGLQALEAATVTHHAPKCMTQQAVARNSWEGGDGLWLLAEGLDAQRTVFNLWGLWGFVGSTRPGFNTT